MNYKFSSSDADIRSFGQISKLCVKKVYVKTNNLFKTFVSQTMTIYFSVLTLKKLEI